MSDWTDSQQMKNRNIISRDTLYILYLAWWFNLQVVVWESNEPNYITILVQVSIQVIMAYLSEWMSSMSNMTGASSEAGTL